MILLKLKNVRRSEENDVLLIFCKGRAIFG